jgi:hypothetical protein
VHFRCRAWTQGSIWLVLPWVGSEAKRETGFQEKRPTPSGGALGGAFSITITVTARESLLVLTTAFERSEITVVMGETARKGVDYFRALSPQKITHSSLGS